MPESTVTRLVPRSARPRADVVVATCDGADDPAEPGAGTPEGDGRGTGTPPDTRTARAGLAITAVPGHGTDRIDGRSTFTTRRDGTPVLRAHLVERFNGGEHGVEIVRTEPRDLAPVIELPVRMHGNRVIEPVDATPGTALRSHAAGYDPTSYDPGPLARALMAMQAADGR